MIPVVSMLPEMLLNFRIFLSLGFWGTYTYFPRRDSNPESVGRPPQELEKGAMSHSIPGQADAPAPSPEHHAGGREAERLGRP